MFHTIQPIVWAFDGEWVPDAAAGRRLLGLAPDLPEREIFEAMWAAAGATPDAPRPYLKTSLCRIVSIAVVERRQHSSGDVSLYLCSLPKRPDDGEADLLGAFFGGLARRRPQLVGYNSQAADLKALIQRGVILGCTAPGLCERPERPWEGPDYFYPHSEWNVDLMRVLGGRGGACPSLKEMALRLPTGHGWPVRRRRCRSLTRMRRPYYLFSNGRLRRRQNTLALERAADARTPGADAHDDGLPSGEPTGERVSFPVEHVDELYCFGEIDVNTKLVTFLAQHGIPVHFFDFYGNYTATLYPHEGLLSGRLKVAQVQHYLSKRRRLVLAHAFVDAALHNILRTLRYFAGRALAPEARVITDAIKRVEVERERAGREMSIPELMAAEGRARDGYYGAWPAILGPRLAEAFPFEHRERRPPSNAVNAAISFGNALCYALCLKQLHRTALDPTVSYLHEPGDRRFSLALDLAEVFKPLLVDRAIFRLLKTGQLQAKHFQPHLGGVYLTEAGRKRFVEHWDERTRRTVQHRRLGRSVSYAHLIRLDAYRLCRHLLDPEGDPYEGLKMWW